MWSVKMMHIEKNKGVEHIHCIELLPINLTAALVITGWANSNVITMDTGKCTFVNRTSCRKYFNNANIVVHSNTTMAGTIAIVMAHAVQCCKRMKCGK